MAIFEIYEGSNGLEMIVSVDRDYFNETIKNEYPNSHQFKKWDEMAWEYLQSRVSIEVNGNCTAFEITEIEYTKDNIYLSGSLKSSIKRN